jgi:uncharacterized Zn finger protein
MTKAHILNNLDYQRGIARACAEGIMILGRVTIKNSDRKGWAVQSGKNTYFVEVVGNQLFCNCKATKKCKHIALVTARYIAEAEAAQTAKTADEQQRDQWLEQHATTPRFPSTVMPLLRGSYR